MVEKVALSQENVVKAYQHLVELSHPDDLIIMEQDIEAPPNAISRLIKLREEGAAIAGGICLVTGAEMKVATRNGGLFKICGLPSVSAYIHQDEREEVKEHQCVTCRNWTYTSKLNGKKGFLPISLQTMKFNSTRLAKELQNRQMYVDAIATGLSIFTREILDELPFEVSEKRTQDLHFCARARERGFKIICDTGLWYEHNHYKYRQEELSDGSLLITLLDSVKGDGITFEVVEPKKEEVELQIVNE